MNRSAYLVILSVCAFSVNGSGAEPTPADLDLWQRIEQATTSPQQFRYTLIKQERLLPDAELAPQETYAVKFRKPYDLYMDIIGGPHSGRHILYRNGWDSLKVHVFNRAFQWLVPKIPPISDRALAGNHHAITDAGFDHTIGTIRENLLRNVRLRKEDPSHPAIQVDPMQEVTEEGIPSYYYRSVSPDVSRTYTVTASDRNMFDVAKKVDNQFYVVMYYNADKIHKWDEVKAGQELKVPYYYAKMSEFWIDRRTLLIWRIRITDFNGKTYEEYRHLDIRTDAAARLTDSDFDPANPDYGF